MTYNLKFIFTADTLLLKEIYQNDQVWYVNRFNYPRDMLRYENKVVFNVMKFGIGKEIVIVSPVPIVHIKLNRNGCMFDLQDESNSRLKPLTFIMGYKNVPVYPSTYRQTQLGENLYLTRFQHISQSDDTVIFFEYYNCTSLEIEFETECVPCVYYQSYMKAMSKPLLREESPEFVQMLYSQSQKGYSLTNDMPVSEFISEEQLKHACFYLSTDIVKHTLANYFPVYRQVFSKTPNVYVLPHHPPHNPPHSAYFFHVDQAHGIEKVVYCIQEEIVAEMPIEWLMLKCLYQSWIILPLPHLSQSTTLRQTIQFVTSPTQPSISISLYSMATSVHMNGEYSSFVKCVSKKTSGHDSENVTMNMPMYRIFEVNIAVRYQNQLLTRQDPLALQHLEMRIQNCEIENDSGVFFHDINPILWDQAPHATYQVYRIFFHPTPQYFSWQSNLIPLPQYTSLGISDELMSFAFQLTDNYKNVDLSIIIMADVLEILDSGGQIVLDRRLYL